MHLQTLFSLNFQTKIIKKSENLQNAIIEKRKEKLLPNDNSGKEWVNCLLMEKIVYSFNR